MNGREGKEDRGTEEKGGIDRWVGKGVLQFRDRGENWNISLEVQESCQCHGNGPAAVTPTLILSSRKKVGASILN